MDHGKYTGGIFIDLKKAYDMYAVNHDILLIKLYHYGIRGIILDWFKLYISNRKQTVSIDGPISNYELISCGVPQGSVLGPPLYFSSISMIYLILAMSFLFIYLLMTQVYYANIKTLTNYKIWSHGQY